MCILFEEAISEGLQQGIEQGIEQGIRILIESCKKLGVRKEDIKKTLMEEYHLSGELAEEKMEIHWKAQ